MLTRRIADLTVALGCAWLGVTLYANLVIGAMTVAFYLGHLLEILAVLLVSVPAALDIKRAAPRARSSATSPRPSWSPPRRPTSARACAP